MSDITPMKPEQLPMLSTSRHGFYPHSNNHHRIVVEENTSIENVCEPSFLAHIAPKLRQYDEITVVTDDGAYYAKLVVLAVGPTWAKTFVLAHEKLSQGALSEPRDFMNPYEVAFKGPQRKWAMLRKQDGAIIRDKMDTKDEAAAYMRDYVRQTTSAAA